MISDPIAENRLHVLFELTPNLSMVLSFLELLSLSLDILHFSLDVVLFPVISNYILESLGALDPLNKTGVSTQRHDRICSESEIPLSSLCISL